MVLEGAPEDSVKAIREIFRSAKEGARLAAVSKAPAFVRWNDATASASIGSVSLAPFVKGMGEKAGVSGWDVKEFLKKDTFWGLTQDQVLAILWQEEGLPVTGTPLWKDLATLWKEQREVEEGEYGEAAVELIKLEALKNANSAMALALLKEEGQELMRLAESKPKGEIEGEKKLPLEVQPTLPATLHAAGWYQVITRLQHPNAKAYWHGLKPQEVEEADWEKSRHRLIATAILFAEMPGCVAYAPRHWRDSRSTFGGGLERSQRWHSRKWFGGTTPFWTLVQWARSGVITPPSMPHGIAMAFVDGLSDDALISSPQWVGGGLVPAGALKVAHHNWNSKTWANETRHQWGNKIALSGLNIRTKISPYLRKQAGELGMGSVHLPGTSVSIHGRNNPLVGKVKALHNVVIGKGDDRERDRARKTFNLWVQNVLMPLIGESSENTPEWEDPENNGW